MKVCRIIPLAAVALVLFGSTTTMIVEAEIREFGMQLVPSSNIHYTQGQLVAPGYISLERLNFTAVGDAGDWDWDDANDDIADDDDSFSFDDDYVASWEEKEGMQAVVDIAVFLLPDSCDGTMTGCDCQELGVGAKTASGDVRWCCDSDAILLGLCDESAGDEYGRLIVNSQQFDLNNSTSFRRYLEVPSTGEVNNKRVSQPRMDVGQTGDYVIVFANCNMKGRSVMVTGETVWMSHGGYLPGDLFRFMYFYILLSIVYGGLFLWNASSMKKHAHRRVPIEKWILMTVLVGCIEVVARSLDYVVWNSGGNRQEVFTYLSILFSAMKSGLLRILLVMLSMRWGVVQVERVDEIGMAGSRRPRWSIVFGFILGCIYIGASAVGYLLIIFSAEDAETLSFEEKIHLMDATAKLNFVAQVITVVFIVWITVALIITMVRLYKGDQWRMLKQYALLACVLILSFLVTTIVSWEELDSESDFKEHLLTTYAVKEVTCVVVMISITVLWRPGRSTEEYSQVESSQDNELELTGSSTSKKDDGHDEEPALEGGYHDERFQIDDSKMS